MKIKLPHFRGPNLDQNLEKTGVRMWRRWPPHWSHQTSFGGVQIFGRQNCQLTKVTGATTPPSYFMWQMSHFFVKTIKCEGGPMTYWAREREISWECDNEERNVNNEKMWTLRMWIFQTTSISNLPRESEPRLIREASQTHWEGLTVSNILGLSSPHP